LRLILGSSLTAARSGSPLGFSPLDDGIGIRTPFPDPVDPPRSLVRTEDGARRTTGATVE
jgi:hypothetical protein